jgi:hypothetical protein
MDGSLIIWLGSLVVGLIFYFVILPKRSLHNNPTFEDILEIELKKFDFEFVESKSMTGNIDINFSIGKVDLGGVPTRKIYKRKVVFLDNDEEQQSCKCKIIMMLPGKYEMKFSPELSTFKSP